jgi:phytoene dehydrogenase-like protein
MPTYEHTVEIARPVDEVFGVFGTLDQIAASEHPAVRGEHHERPFVLLVQSSLFDQTRAPAGKHTAWG